ncbi:SRPBCC family protein [Flavobacterium sp. CBA20B-1]|uniref:SRPBCC family protein n=1 Tax=unclassified Flavobacterium TaxID=196869 RepID=UPI002224F75D|nr:MULTISPECIES: SRPBCC family protein [unclassified Flavobacterium]WCM41498.1 SRPBCC family protein [Flavobacterium sp. CBA20B-1]
MRYQLKRTQQLYCDIETAWQFFSSPHNLAVITPKEMGFDVLTALNGESIYVGQEIAYKITPLLNIPMRWTTLITQVDEGKSFTDFQKKGPYKYWNHFHEFIPNEEGVFMNDTVDYELPLGPIGNIAHKLMVQKKLEHIFNYRYKVLEKLFANK